MAITDEALHLLARVLLRVCSPKHAYSIVVKVGGLLPPLPGGPEALRRAAIRLGPRGTCLSRALTMAARVPEADLVIGVLPRVGQRLFAHAWVELAGKPIDPSDVAGGEIARLRRPYIGSSSTSSVVD